MFQGTQRSEAGQMLREPLLPRTSRSSKCPGHPLTIERRSGAQVQDIIFSCS
ncbi:unnamed protein product, partial [Nesidiocoris tenuis]